MADGLELDTNAATSLSRRQAVLAELGLRALQEEDMEIFLEHAVQRLAELLDVEYCKVLELLPDGGELLLRAGTGWQPGLIGEATVPTGSDSQAGYTLLSGEPVVVRDLQTETRFTGPALLREHAVVSGVSVVVPGQNGRPYGVLGAHTTRNRTFTQEDAGFLQSAATVLAGALRRGAHEKALRATEAKYRSLVEGLPLVTYVDALDETVSSVYASPQIEPLLGYTRAEWIGDPNLFSKTLHADDRERVLAEHARLRATGERLRTEYRLIARDGRVVWVQDEATVIEDESGSPSLLQGVLLDVTERKQLEDQLRQAQKIEAVGQLAGGIAHDFNNLLTAILGYADLLLERLGPLDALSSEVRQIALAADRASGLTRQLLAFCRKQVLEPVILDLNEVLSGVEHMLRRVIDESIEIVTVLDPQLGRTRADRGQTEQVIVNLALNARDAMAAGGVLTLETANAELDSSAVPAGIAPGSYVVLTVTDTGCGIDAETLPHLFEPFFTTKGKRGTGLGLSTVYGIVGQSGGFVAVDSTPGAGSTFRVYLPLHDGGGTDTERNLPPQGTSATLGGGETILLVENHDQVRTLLARDLAERGFTVLAAAGPEEALALLSAQPGGIDLLLTDLVLPGASGSQLAAEATRLLPGTRVLYMSGYAGSLLERQGIPGPVIEKPFDTNTLLMRIREVLDAR